MKKFLALFVASLFLFGCVEDVLKPWKADPRTDPEFVVLDMPQAGVEANCQWFGQFVLPEGYSIRGCVLYLGERKPGEACVIFINMELPYAEYLLTLEHEKAHCRGWEHGEPQPTGSR